MHRPLPSFNVRFGVAFGGAALLGEGINFLPWDKLLNGYVYERWPPNSEDRGGRVLRLSAVARQVLASFGNVASAGTAGYLAARTVFVSKSGVVDALMARPFDSRSIITQAGGRVGLRSAVYFGALKVAAYAASEAAFSGDPFRFLLLAPAGMFALMFGFPVFLPFLGVAWAGGRLVGFSLGSRAVAHLGASGASPTSLVHGSLFTHPIDRFFTARPFLATSGAVLVSIAAMLPELEEDVSNGGDDGNGGFTWRYEKRWSPSAPTIDDHDEQPPPEEEEEEEEHRRGESGTARKEVREETQGNINEKGAPNKEQRGKDGGGGEWV